MKQKSSITKAVITAAGRGTRFLPIVKGYPKELLPLLNKPNIQLLVEEAIGAGINQICIVHRHGDPSLKRYFTPDTELSAYLKKNNKTAFLSSLQTIWEKTKILKFIPQPRRLPYGNASPALAAQSFIGSDPFVYMFGDDLAIETIPGTFLSKMIKVFQQTSADIVAATQMVPWSEIDRYGSILFDKKEKSRIRGVFEKVPRQQAPSNYTQWGRFITDFKIIKNLKQQAISRANELWWSDTVNHWAEEGKVISVTSPKNLWMTTGDPIRWLKANITLALRHPQYKKDIKAFLKTL